MRRLLGIMVLSAVLLLETTVRLPACSLCPSGTQQALTLREEAAQPFAKMILHGRVLDSELRPDGTGTCRFAIDRVLRKDDVLGERKEITLNRYVPVLDKKNPPEFLLYCDVYQNKIDSYRGIPARADLIAYLNKAMALDPKDAVARLRFYFDYLEHPEKEIAGDAFLEFAKADDRHIGEAAGKFPADRVRGWLKEPKTPSDRIGVYAFLLGVCGDDTDASLLQSMLNDTSDRTRNAHDGILSGLLHRKPREGWELVLSGLADGRTPLPLRLAMVRAVRVLFTWQPEQNKANTLKACRALLAQGELADLAIEDLRRWKVWDLTADILALYGKRGYTAPILERAIVRYALTHKMDTTSQQFIAARRKDKLDLVKEVEEGLEFEK